MGLSDWLKGKKEVALIERTFGQALEHIRAEKGVIFSWLHYFKEKDKIHEERYTQMQRSTARHQENIGQLRDELFELKTVLHQLRTEKGQQRTSERTTQGHEKSREKQVVVQEKHTLLFDKQTLKGSELEILQVLYYADRPLSYQEIAKQLSKTEKSIRNLVYELRKKGVEIESKPVGLRQQGFYLREKTKILLSGRK